MRAAGRKAGDRRQLPAPKFQPGNEGIFRFVGIFGRLIEILLIRGLMMKSVVVRMLIALVIMAALVAGQTARADGPLPLKQGTYVAEGVLPCDRAGNAYRIYYEDLEEGYGFSWPHSACTITKVRNKGNVYYVTQKGIFKGVEGIVTVHLTITVKSETSFSIISNSLEPKNTKKKERAYRWCQD